MDAGLIFECLERAGSVLGVVPVLLVGSAVCGLCWVVARAGLVFWHWWDGSGWPASCPAAVPHGEAARAAVAEALEGPAVSDSVVDEELPAVEAGPVAGAVQISAPPVQSWPVDPFAGLGG